MPPSCEFTCEPHQWAAGASASCHAIRKSITFSPSDTSSRPDQLFFTLPASKTDPFRQGFATTIAAAGDPACGVSALHLRLERRPSPPETPLFTLYHPSVAAFDRRIVVSGLHGWLVAAGIQVPTRVTPSGGEPPRQPGRRAWRITIFSCWADGAQMHTSAISKSILSTSTMYHANSKPPNPASRHNLPNPNNPARPPTPNTPARPPPFSWATARSSSLGLCGCHLGHLGGASRDLGYSWQ